MKTDKQVFRIFEAVPEWLFQLTGLESPGPCQLRSFTLKELERRADGLVVPTDPWRPLMVVEFQFQQDQAIYTRTVREMVAAQELYEMRAVEGLIVFAYNDLDPQTEPWTRVVRSFSFDNLLASLEQSLPEHPLVAVFKPLFVEDDAALAESAVRYFQQIRSSELNETVKAALLEVFVSWLEQRFHDKGKKEIEAMLTGELPDLEKTQSGKDLIAIGEKRGEKRGKIESILVFLESKHGAVPLGLRKAVSKLSAAKTNQLLTLLPQCESFDDIQAWLDNNT